MQEYNVQVKKTVRQMSLLTALICVSAWISGQSGYIPGFVAGSLAGGVYVLLMCYRIKKSADMPMHKAMGYMRTGLLLRLLFLAMVLFLSVKLPWIDFWSAVIGLFSFYMMFLYNTVIYGIRNGIYKRKG